MIQGQLFVSSKLKFLLFYVWMPPLFSSRLCHMFLPRLPICSYSPFGILYFQVQKYFDLSLPSVWLMKQTIVNEFITLWTSLENEPKIENLQIWTNQLILSTGVCLVFIESYYSQATQGTIISPILWLMVN